MSDLATIEDARHAQKIRRARMMLNAWHDEAARVLSAEDGSTDEPTMDNNNNGGK
jgi:hypothetical protein